MYRGILITIVFCDVKQAPQLGAGFFAEISIFTLWFYTHTHTQSVNNSLQAIISGFPCNLIQTKHIVIYSELWISSLSLMRTE